jgi:hypothetical protein
MSSKPKAPLPTQIAPKATSPKIPPFFTPPSTAEGGDGFVTGKGRGPRVTGKGQNR